MGAPETGDTLQSQPGTRQWDYGAPMPPTNLRATPTATVINTNYQVNVSWDAPVAFAENIDRFRAQWYEVGGTPSTEWPQTVHTPNASARRNYPLTMPKGDWDLALALGNDVGWGLPNDVHVVVGMPAWPPGRVSLWEPAITERTVTEEVNGTILQVVRTALIGTVVTEKQPWVTEIEFEYWPRFNRRTFSRKVIDTTGFPGDPDTSFTVIARLTEGLWTITARARNERGWGPRTAAEVNVTGDNVGGGPPRAVRNLTASAGARGKATVSWTPPLEDGTSGTGGLPIRRYEYSVNRSCANARSLVIRDRELYTPKASYSITITLARGTQPVSVRAVNSKGNGPCSDTSVQVQ